MTDRDLYAEIAPFYDLEFEDFAADFDLYLGYAHLVGGPVLELGCGTGRLLVPLAEAGFEVTGLDNSGAMIQSAELRLRERNAVSGITLRLGDMRDLRDFSELTFNLVFAAINSFLHLESREDQLQSLRQIRSVLDRDGLLVIDVFNPAPDTLMRMDDHYTFDGAWSLESGARLERFSHRELDSANQTVTTHLFYDEIDPNGRTKRRSTTYRMRYIHRFEIESLLSECGFELEGVYGSYALDPLEHDSEQLIVVAHRTRNPGED